MASRPSLVIVSLLNSYRIGGPRPIDEKNSISKQHFSKSERGMNATGSSLERGDTSWSMAPDA
jgi:hypothetical protein